MRWKTARNSPTNEPRCPPPLTPDALRMRRYRRRQREGLLQVQIEVPCRYVELLILGGYLEDQAAGDPERLGNALLTAARQSLDGA